MAVIKFKTVERSVGDGLATFFAWPRTGETFTYTFSIDNGISFSAGSEAIAEMTVDGDVAEYTIPYNATERPAGAGNTIYAVTDGTDSGKVYVAIKPGAASLGVGSVSYPVTVQDEDSAPVSGATINVRDSDGNSLGIQGITNQSGIINFQLEAVEYQFAVSALNGYDPHTPVNQTVVEGQSLILTINSTTDEVTIPDLSGIKRVKTKHMEIEAHDPRIMQDVRDREVNQHPCFENLHFCKGKHKCE